MPQDLSRTFRWLRKAEGAPPSVSWAWAGPPDLDLDDREQFLVSLRSASADAGFRLARVRSGFRHRIVAVDDDSTTEVAAHEQRADAAGHWWLGHLIWISQDGAVLVGLADPDGYDLWFQAWGPSADNAMSVVRRLLEDKRPQSSS